jgi:hypothetical protein
MKSLTFYLPLKKSHIIPITDLSPDEITSSCKKAYEDREKISHVTKLNACAKALGFKGGFAGYKSEFYAKIVPFMAKNQLNKLTDLVTPRYIGYGYPILNLSYQDISERLFFSNKAIPKKIFTGYNFHYERHFDDGHMLYAKTFGLDSNIESKLKLVKEDPFREVPTPSYTLCNTRYLIDLIIGSELLSIIEPGLNLVGDQLVIPRETTIPELCLYQRAPSLTEKENEFFNFFVQRLDSIGQGWVEVIPYNDNLIFLKGENGEYSFVFRNQRNDKFEHKTDHQPYLKSVKEVPKFEDSYHFDRWFYFEHEGFRSKISHEAEKCFYTQGGEIETYPGEREVLKRYLDGEYKNYLKNSNKLLDNFHKFEFSSGQVLMVSDLISIKDFEHFKYENYEYLARRWQPNANDQTMDNLETANAEDDDSLPVALTGHDLLKYIDWFNEKHGIEARLLSLDEYQEITPFVSLAENPKALEELYSSDECCVFIEENGSQTRQPPYMEEGKFQSLKMRFNNPKFVIKNQLKFIDSHFFAEWLRDFSCIRSNSLTSFSGDKYFRYKPPLSSTGRYKYIKIGFRLCYELEA